MWNNQGEPTEFGRALLALIGRSGFRSRADFARHVDIQSSTISRWITKPNVPEPKLLARVAERLANTPAEREEIYSQLMQAAGHLGTPETPKDWPVPDMHPLARDLARMLGQHSPLPPADRDLLEKMIEKVMGGFR